MAYHLIAKLEDDADFSSVIPVPLVGKAIFYVIYLHHTDGYPVACIYVCTAAKSDCKSCVAKCVTKSWEWKSAESNLEGGLVRGGRSTGR